MEPANINYRISLEKVEGAEKQYRVQMFKGDQKVSLKAMDVLKLQSEIRAMVPKETREQLPGRITIETKGSFTGKVDTFKNLEITRVATGALTNQPRVAEKKLDPSRFLWKKVALPDFAKRAFASIRKVFGRVIQKIQQLFQKFFNPKEYQAEQEDYAKKLYETATKRFGVLQSEEATKFGENAPLTVKEAVIQSEKSPLQQRSHMKRAAVEGGLHENVPEFTSGGVTIIPTTVINGEVSTGKVVPSSMRSKAGEKITSKENHLLNCYTNKENGVIRSGVIDTPEKASEFLSIAKDMRPDQKIRLVSHQLNSYLPEGKMIDNQHRNLLSATFKENDIQIAHFNTAANRLMEFEKLLPEKLQRFEIKSRDQNLEGLAQTALWLLEDIKGVEGVNMENLQLAINGIQDCYSRNDLKDQLEKIQNWRSEYLIPGLKTVYVALEKKEDDERVHLMRKLLEVQLFSGSMSRGQEVMIMHLLNEKLGVISAVNCKTGADRTGFVNAIKFAQLQTKGVFDLVMNWDEISVEMNQYVAKNGHESLQAAFEGRSDWQQANEFRKHVLENLIKHTLPITIVSAGVPGLKWSKGFKQNRVPLNFLPSHIMNEKGEAIQIVAYKQNGEIEGLTKAGQKLLLQHSSKRGA